MRNDRQDVVHLLKIVEGEHGEQGCSLERRPWAGRCWSARGFKRLHQTVSCLMTREEWGAMYTLAYLSSPSSLSLLGTPTSCTSPVPPVSRRCHIFKAPFDHLQFGQALLLGDESIYFSFWNERVLYWWTLTPTDCWARPILLLALLKASSFCSDENVL